MSKEGERQMSMRIGFIGLGIMGQPMAHNLMRAGFPLVVFNRTRAKCQPLVEAGAVEATSYADVARRSDVIITIVSDTPDVERVLFGPDGVQDGVTPGKILIDMSTISPAATEEMAARLEQKGCRMLDAPVSGGLQGATAGTLAIMVGGDLETFQTCLPIFQAMGKKIVYMGRSGNGQRTKMINQVIAALNIVAMTEGLYLAKLAGLNLADVLDVVSSGAAGSWMLTHAAPKILQQDYTPGFMMKLQQKDLRLALEFAKSLSGTLPGTELAYALFSEAVNRGLGEQGTQGLINIY
ncbi:MAG: NAD(P)-dependent oxidoreductase [Blastocatellia bacterium]|nr:NAD(P)-dependent oxidoreductase [Blastocatellia bacterium]